MSLLPSNQYFLILPLCWYSLATIIRSGRLWLIVCHFYIDPPLTVCHVNNYDKSCDILIPWLCPRSVDWEGEINCLDLAVVLDLVSRISWAELVGFLGWFSWAQPMSNLAGRMDHIHGLWAWITSVWSFWTLGLIFSLLPKCPWQDSTRDLTFFMHVC